MYIKYKNDEGIIKFEPLSLSFVPNHATVCVDGLGECHSVAYAIVNGYDTEAVRSLRECVEQVHLDNDFDVVDYLDVLHDLIAVGEELFYTQQQTSAFIYLLEKALKNKADVFDITNLTLEELKSYIPKATKKIPLPTVLENNGVIIKIPCDVI